jgi:glycosyltransferase involved in cell wall biosynthesis
LKRIAIVCRHAGGTGSVGFVAVRQAKELAKRFEVTLLSETFPADLPGVRQLQVRGRNFDFLRRFAHVPNERSFAAAARRALFALHAENPLDLVLCHSHATAVLSALPLKQRHGVPVAVFSHGDIFDRPPGTYDRRLTKFFERVAPLAYRHSDLVFVLSAAMGDRARSFGATDHTVVVMPNGVDPAEFGLTADSPPRSLRNHGPLRLLFVGRLAVEKGIPILLRACEQLTDVDFNLTIAGGGPRETELRALAAGPALAGRVALTGSVPRGSLGAVYRGADLLIAPSLSEAFPVVALEALASGLPVIASDVSGHRESIVDGVNGLLVPVGDPAALAGAIRGLAVDRARLAELASHAAKSVERFGWERVGVALGEAIERKIGEGWDGKSQKSE